MGWGGVLMWLVLRQSDNRVVRVEDEDPGEITGYEVFEWEGDVDFYPREYLDPEDGQTHGEVLGFDPRVSFDSGREKFEELATKAEVEIAWLEATIPLIDTMNQAELVAVIKRLAQENREMLKAWRYVLNKLW
jgi:hypothetical protein